MSLYNQQHRDAILMVREHLSGLSLSRLRLLRDGVRPYLEYREDVARFQDAHLADLCSEKCFSSRTSACCGREGILVFFADVVVNALLSDEGEIDALLTALARDGGGFNCVYLQEKGCLWRLKPIACEMFLCDHAREAVLDVSDHLRRQWEGLRRQERRFTRPTQKVLFDELERAFIEAGYDSPLMYLHRSPGLLRLKAKHGVR